MTARKIVQIDREKCNGCGICVDSCAEGAIQMLDGKAILVSDSYCDGLGDCLAPCPTGAISIVTRDADPFDAQAAEKHVAKQKQSSEPLPCGCPGTFSRSLKKPHASPSSVPSGCGDDGCCQSAGSELANWPIQLKLVPPNAPYFQNVNILLAADCAAAASPDFHARYLRNRPLVIACPKLEENAPQIDKLAQIIKQGEPSGITVLRMEVPCCGGLVRVAEEAVRRSGRHIPVTTTILSLDGKEIAAKSYLYQKNTPSGGS